MTIRSQIRSITIALLVLCGENEFAAPLDAAWIGYAGSWYSATTAPSTALAAEATAQSFGGHLVAINSLTEQHFLAATFNNQLYWIGLTDAAQEGVFKWMDGAPLTYSNWYSGEPNNAGDEDFVVMNWANSFGVGYWNDWNASNQAHGIMEVLNLAPVAQVAAVAPVSFGNLVNFNASLSSDPNAALGDFIVSYEWVVNSSFYYQTAVPQLSFNTGMLAPIPTSGSFIAWVRGVDSLGMAGAWHAFAFDVTVPAPPPMATPEPSSLALLLTGGFLGALRLCRRNVLGTGNVGRQI